MLTTEPHWEAEWNTKSMSFKSDNGSQILKSSTTVSWELRAHKTHFLAWSVVCRYSAISWQAMHRGNHSCNFLNMMCASSTDITCRTCLYQVLYANLALVKGPVWTMTAARASGGDNSISNSPSPLKVWEIRCKMTPECTTAGIPWVHKVRDCHSYMTRSNRFLYVEPHLSQHSVSLQVHYNVGKNLADRGREESAIQFYREAVRYCWIN